MADWQAKEDKVQDMQDATDFIQAYLKDLLHFIKDPYLQTNLDAAGDTLMQSLKHKCENIANYRDKVFKSHFTGTSAVENPVPWIEVDGNDSSKKCIEN